MPRSGNAAAAMARILMVLSGVDYWTLANGTKHPSG
ncbi:hypothetical protein QFZ74_000514 [Streptomyces sp. V3I7]|nr:hypothetical protein [Streptomyces sp. V3I7]